MAESPGRRRPSARTRSARGSRGSKDVERERSQADSRRAREERARARAEAAEFEARARAEQAASIAAASREASRQETRHATKRSAPVDAGARSAGVAHPADLQSPHRTATVRGHRPTPRRTTSGGSVSRETFVRADEPQRPSSRGERLTTAQTRRSTSRSRRTSPNQSNRRRPSPSDEAAQSGAERRQPRPRKHRRGRVIAIVAVCVACAIGIGLLVTSIVGAVNAPPPAAPDEQPGLTIYDVDASDPESAPPYTAGETTVSLSAVGDNLMHLPVVETADLAEGSVGDELFDFGAVYSGLSEILATHDINFIDVETPMGGDERGYSGYPVFNTPSDDAADIASAGFNLATTATNHAWDQGFEGIQSMSETWSEHPEVVVAGTYTSQADRDNIRTFSKNGLTFAFLAYQDNLNGFVLPDDQQWAVGDSHDTEQLRTDIRKAHELAECVIVAMSWGDEYSFEPNESQRETAQLFADEGVDLVLGFGPHVIQPVEWIQGKDKGTDADGQPVDHRTLVVYSLGNYVSNQQQTMNLVEGCFTCNFVRDAEGAIAIQDPMWTPLVGHMVSGGVNYGFTGHNTYPIYDYTEEMARKNPVLGGLDDPLGYVRDLTLEVIDPEVVTIDWDGTGKSGGSGGSSDSVGKTSADSGASSDATGSDTSQRSGDAAVANAAATQDDTPADNEPMTVQ